MRLLIQRSQDETMFLRHPIFKLWAKFECTPEENALITKYQVGDNLLTEGRPGEMKRAASRAAIFTSIFTVFVLIIISHGYLRFTIMPLAIPGLVIMIWIIAFVFSWFLIYQQIREFIKVDDMLRGRLFKCKTVVMLIDREEELAELGFCFRQVLEAMKNWGGWEIIELRPYKAPTLQLGKLS